MRYEVIESKQWKRDDGATASPYGACPWTSDAERPRWTLQSRGYTLRDNATGNIGVYGSPWPTREEADARAATLNQPKTRACYERHNCSDENAHREPLYYRIYARAEGEKRFKAMDMKAGRQVGNLIYATIYPAERKQELEKWLEEMRADNPDWGFELRPTN